MPAVQYPFIDIAVHPRIRERFARGEAMALFSASLDRVLWANGAGADLFGHPAIYDFIEQGPKQGDVSFRQVASTAHQLSAVGDTRSFLIRIAAGFQRVVVNATVELVRIQAGEEAVLFSCPVSAKALDAAESARRMLEGFDDPDTHMAVMGRDGEIIASSTGFKALGITPHTASMLVTMAGTQPERMIKRPIPTGQGYLPAAIGRLSDSPALHLLFVVEMIIGHLDPVESGVAAAAVEAEVPPQTVNTSEPATPEPEETLSELVPSEPAILFVEAPAVDAAAAPLSDIQSTDTHIPPVMEAASDASKDALAGALAAMPSTSLPADADAPNGPVGEDEVHHALETADLLDEEAPDALAAISADHLPAEAAATPDPAGAFVTGHTDAHDLHDEIAGLINTAQVDVPEWATSELPAVAVGALDYLDIGLEQAPHTAAHLHDEDVSDMPAVQAADIAHQLESDAIASNELTTSDITSEPAHADVENDVVAAETTEIPVVEAQHKTAQDSPAFTAMIDAVAGIEDLDDAPEEIIEEEQPSSAASIDESAAAQDADVVETRHGSAETDAPTDAIDAIDAPAADDHENHGFAAASAAEEPAEKEAEVDPVEQDAPPAEHMVDEHAHAEAMDTDDVAPEHRAPAAGEEDAALTAGEELAIDEPAEFSTEAPIKSISDEMPVVGEPENPVEAQIADAPSAETITAPDDTEAGFVFNRNGRATRFVWKIDAAGRFSEISREFAEAVGPHATSVAGVAFTDIAALFNLDPDGKIAELLARRDTWSGRTIHWPVEGTTLTVPVDLAALPTYTRSREFDGFRGFGVVRLSDAAEDPMKIGLTLGRDAEVVAELATQEAVAAPSFEHENEAATATGQNDVELAVSHEMADTSDSEAPLHNEPAASETEEPELPFNGEPPALKISETPGRRLSDKVIQLHEHRLSISDSLSPSEQAAFRGIAKQLEPFGKRGEPPVEQTNNSKPEADEIAATTDNAPVHLEGAEGTDEQPAPHIAANDDNKGAQEPAAADAAEQTDEEFDPLAVLNTAIPPRSKMTDGLSSEIVDQLPVAILVHAGDTLIHANPEFLRLTGYKDLAEVEGVGGLDALLQRNDLQGKTERPGTMVLVRADDALVPVTARLQSIRWEDSSALMLALMPVEKEGDTEDAAPRPEARDEARPERMLEKVAKLQVEVEELQSILETATDGVAIIGPEGDIRSMNRSASALFNYDEQETRGKPFVMLFAHESQKAVLDYLAGLTGNGVASVLNDGREVIGREASGGFVPLFMTMGVLTSSNGYCAVIRDITQWKRTEEELRNAKRAAETANAHKSDFLARVSHEIRTPLNAIIGFSDMMASERLGPIGHARYVEYAGDIGRSGRHVLDIVNDLLDISKIEAGEMELEFGSVGLNAAIAEAVSIVQPQANGQRVIIRTALAQAVPNVVADLRSIKQIALNILSNAIRFTPSGGQIVVSTSYEGNGSVVLRIRDTGVGMTRTELEQAMKPFRQVATNSRQRGDGTGLGLPLTKAMVDANRALFAIHSAPNEGTLVEVTFPSQRVLAN